MIPSHDPGELESAESKVLVHIYLTFDIECINQIHMFNIDIYEILYDHVPILP